MVRDHVVTLYLLMNNNESKLIIIPFSVPLIIFESSAQCGTDIKEYGEIDILLHVIF